jgi:hypothetical protein
MSVLAKSKFFSLSEKLKLVVILLLNIASLALFQLPDRYTLAHKNILPNADFSELGAHWNNSGKGIFLTANPGRHLILTNESRRQTLVTQAIDKPQRFENIRVSVDISVGNIAAGRSWWMQAGVLLLGYDKNRARMRYWPYRVALVSGTRDWKTYEAVIPISANMQRLQLFILHGGSSGQFLVRNLIVDAVEEEFWFRAAKVILIGFWIISGIWVLLPTLINRRRSAIAHLSFLAYISMLAGALTPQPLLSEILHPKLQTLAGFSKPPKVAGEKRAENGASKQQAKDKQLDAEKSPPGKKNLIASKMSHLPANLEGDSGQYTAHFLSHIVLGLLVALAFRETAWWKLFAYLLLAATTIELLQVFVITRSAGFGDGSANAAGVTTGLAFYYILRRIRPHVTSKFG